MATYTVINGTEADLISINAGATNVGSMTYRDGVILSNAELAALCQTKGVAVTKDMSGFSDHEQIMRAIGIAALYPNTLL